MTRLTSCIGGRNQMTLTFRFFTMTMLRRTFGLIREASRWRDSRRLPSTLSTQSLLSLLTISRLSEHPHLLLSRLSLLVRRLRYWHRQLSRPRSFPRQKTSKVICPSNTIPLSRFSRFPTWSPWKEVGLPRRNGHPSIDK